MTADELTSDHARLLADIILRHRGVVWRRSPADQADHLVIPNATNEVTHVIDLRGGADEARAQWKKEACKDFRRAEKLGTRVRLADSLEDWLAYDGLYRLSLERWAAPSSFYERSLFTLLYELDSPAVRLWLAEREGCAVSGLVVFNAHRHAVEWHGASVGREAQGASNLLKWCLLDLFEAEGVETYDLNPSGGHEGVVRFKETMGAVSVPAPIVIQVNPLEAAVRRTQRWRRRLRVRLPAA